jgi:hypothetical protein
VYVFYELRIIDRVLQWKQNFRSKRQPHGGAAAELELESRLKPARDARQASLFSPPPPLLRVSRDVRCRMLLAAYTHQSPLFLWRFCCARRFV